MVSPNRPENKIPSYDNSKAYILKSVERSLRNFKSDYIDLLLIHRPSPLMNPTTIVEAFTQLKKEGKVNHFGVSNFTPSQFDLLNNYIPLCTNQVEASLVKLDFFLDGTFDQAIKYNAKPMIWSPLGSGRLFSEPNDPTVIRIKKVTEKLMDKYACGYTQIYLAFLMHHPAQLIPVLGTSKIERVQEAVKSLEIALTDEEWFELWSASMGKALP